VHELGYAAAKAQLLTIPPFVLGCICTIVVGIVSDNLNLRGPFIAGSAFVRYIPVRALRVRLTSYIGLPYWIYCAVHSVKTGCCVRWCYTRCHGRVPYDCRRHGMGWRECWWYAQTWRGARHGNRGGQPRRVNRSFFYLLAELTLVHRICSSFVYLDPPRFHKGHGTMMGWLGFRYDAWRIHHLDGVHAPCFTRSIILSLISMWNYNRLNKEKIALCEREGIDHSQAVKFREMGDKSPLFRYTL
jgi:hypothetical protein